jgi:hypothetical protein
MIISHHFKYCFFAIPRTGSQALSRHLIDNYKGIRMGRMHAGFEEFHRDTHNTFKDYFSFTIIRHPLDSIVSAYFKKKTDHNQRFSRGVFRNGRRIGRRSMEEYRFIKEHDASFSDYFLHFFTEPLEWPRHTNTKSSVDMVLRFETIEPDFQAVCKKLHMPNLTIPKINKTSSRSSDWRKYYDQEARQRAKQAVAPLMQIWGYDFPQDW